MVELTRVIDTGRGPLLVTVQRVSDRYTTRELASEDLLKAARVLFRKTALMSQQARRPAPEAATVGMVEEAS